MSILLNAFLSTIASIRFGIVLLIILISLSFLGMVVMQQNVRGFAAYYAGLPEYQRDFFGALGLFEIYKTFYFNGVIAALAMNIVIASLDRLPAVWEKVRRPPPFADRRAIESMPRSVVIEDLHITGNEAASAAERTLRASGYRRTTRTEVDGDVTVIADRGSWNRLGPYAVHLGLLILLAGWMITNYFARAGQLPVRPGQTTNLLVETAFTKDGPREVTSVLPFTITCTDMSQRLIDPKGSIRAQNTLDWITTLVIDDGNTRTEAELTLNNPVDYRGYRIFHSDHLPLGKARKITLEMVPEGGREAFEVVIDRGETVTVPDGTTVHFSDFRANFRFEGEDPLEDTSDYPGPAAVLKVKREGGEYKTAFALGGNLVLLPMVNNYVAGYRYRLLSFERVADQHILAVQRDPGVPLLYSGFLILAVSLLGTFFWSHREVWLRFEQTGDGRTRCLIGGRSNRNPEAFEGAFRNLVSDLSTEFVEPARGNNGSGGALI